MKITEKMLLDGFNGITNGGTLISKIGDETVWWSYRDTSYWDGHPVCNRENAGEITLEYSRNGIIEVSCENDSNVSLSKISEAEESLWGVNVQL